MIIHCTQKLAAKLKNVSTEPLSGTSPLGSRHANLYTIDRRLCVIFCHDLCRSVLLMTGLRREHFVELDRWHRELFLAILRFQGVPATLLKRSNWPLDLWDSTRLPTEKTSCCKECNKYRNIGKINDEPQE